jgi:hypothetical protein
MWGKWRDWLFKFHAEFCSIFALAAEMASYASRWEANALRSEPTPEKTHRRRSQP